MNNQERQFTDRQYTIFGIIFTLIVLVSLAGLVFVRSYASDQANVTQNRPLRTS
jgi:hypothetical protein